MDLATEKKTPIIQHLLTEKFSGALTVSLQNASGCIGSITFYVKFDNPFDYYEQEFLERYIKLVEIILNAQ